MVVGWDIGGVNTKVALVRGGQPVAVHSRAYELQRAPAALSAVLRELSSAVGAGRDVAHAITMTAELSQMFRTKREGVAFVLEAAESAFAGAPIHVFTVDGDFLSCAKARQRPHDVAAANWSATAHAVSAWHTDAILVDIGTTTTDVIPIVAGLVRADGRTDPERLASGELVYTGAVRTPVEAILSEVTIAGRQVGVSAEVFALVGDAHVWRGHLAPGDYSAPTPDGRPPTREFAGERLARVVCSDRELLPEPGVSAIADAVAQAQIERVATAIRRVAARHAGDRPAVVTGLGAFIARTAAAAAGLEVIALSDSLGDDAARSAPATSVALLLDRWLSRRSIAGDARHSAETSSGGEMPIAVALEPTRLEPVIEKSAIDQGTAAKPIVVKLGGSILQDAKASAGVLDLLDVVGTTVPLVIVPGGGLLADAVRTLDARLSLDDSTAHWMAVLAMDQFAYVVAARLTHASLVRTREEIAAALSAGRVAVLAPAQWLRTVDPLPHSWEVTSDSIAAWVAREVDAERVVMIKATGATEALLDLYLTRTIDVAPSIQIVHANELDALRAALSM